MGIDTERDIEANLQIGPTDQGMVRLFIEAGKTEIPMDFDPDEAREIAEEILSAAQAAEAMSANAAKPLARGVSKVYPPAAACL